MIGGSKLQRNKSIAPYVLKPDPRFCPEMMLEATTPYTSALTPVAAS